MHKQRQTRNNEEKQRTTKIIRLKKEETQEQHRKSKQKQNGQKQVKIMKKQTDKHKNTKNKIKTLPKNNNNK